MVQTRNVVSQDDAFLYELYISTRKNEFSTLALDEQQLHALLLIQYEAQKRFYQQNFPQAKHEIIFHEQSPIQQLASPTCMLFHFLNFSFTICMHDHSLMLTLSIAMHSHSHSLLFVRQWVWEALAQTLPHQDNIVQP